MKVIVDAAGVVVDGIDVAANVVVVVVAVVAGIAVEIGFRNDVDPNVLCPNVVDPNVVVVVVDPRDDPAGVDDGKEKPVETAGFVPPRLKLKPVDIF